MVAVKYDVTIQNKIVAPSFLLGSSALAVATAAKHGIVVILKAMKEIKPGKPIPVVLIIWIEACSKANAAWF